MGHLQHSMVGGGGGFKLRATIAANMKNYNLFTAAVAAGWNQIDPIDAIITIGSGVVIGSSSIAVAAFDTGSVSRAGNKIQLINNGIIAGKGGNANGNPGGLAFRAQAAIRVSNNGTIGGGGGGGGAGGGVVTLVNPKNSQYAYSAGGGGGGGAGSDPGTGGSYQGSQGGLFIYTGVSNGGPGTAITGGNGGGGTYGNYAGPNGYVRAGSGGNGGGLGSSGGAGSLGYYAGEDFGTRPAGADTSPQPTAGGAAGAAIAGNANITWDVLGTRLGVIA